MSDAAVTSRTPLIGVRDEGPVRELRLRRESRHNALTPELLTELRSQIAAALDSHGVRAILITAAGPSFSTGGDVAEFVSRHGNDLTAYAETVVGELNGVILDLLAAQIPVISAVHGPVTGGSLGLVLASDIAVAGPQAWFQPYYTEVGFSPDGGWTALLPRRVGCARARAWQVANERVDAREAVSAGLVSHYAQDPRGAAAQLAEAAARRKAGSVRHTKQLLTPVEEIAASLEEERRAFLAQITTEEARRGMDEFLAGTSSPSTETDNLNAETN